MRRGLVEPHLVALHGSSTSSIRAGYKDASVYAREIETVMVHVPLLVLVNLDRLLPEEDNATVNQVAVVNLGVWYMETGTVRVALYPDATTEWV